MPFKTCEVTASRVGPLLAGEQPITKFPTKGMTIVCARMSTAPPAVRCTIVFEDGSANNDFDAILDESSPGRIYLHTLDYADYIVASPLLHGAVVQTRIVSGAAVGTKQCYGAFLTGAEWDAVQADRDN